MFNSFDTCLLLVKWKNTNILQAIVSAFSHLFTWFWTIVSLSQQFETGMCDILLLGTVYISQDSGKRC